MWKILAEDLPSGLQSLIPYLGIPGTMLAVLIYAMARGWLITGRESAKDLRQCHQVEEDLRKRLDDRDKEWRERYDLITEEKNMWRDTALKNLNALENATRTAVKAGDRLSKQRGEES